MFEFLFAERSVVQSCPAPPSNTLDCDDECGDDVSAWAPLATAMAMFKLYAFAEEQQKEWVIEEYGSFADKLLYRLERFTGKRKRE